MYYTATTAEAKASAHKALLEEQRKAGRKVSPWVRNAVLGLLPAKELGK